MTYPFAVSLCLAHSSCRIKVESESQLEISLELLHNTESYLVIALEELYGANFKHLHFLVIFCIAQMESPAHPGPTDNSVLYDQDNHVSSAVWDGQV